MKEGATQPINAVNHAMIDAWGEASQEIARVALWEIDVMCRRCLCFFLRGMTGKTHETEQALCVAEERYNTVVVSDTTVP